MTLTSIDPYEGTQEWLPISREESRDADGRTFTIIKYKTNPQFKLAAVWRVVYLVAAILCSLTIAPACIFRKKVSDLFKLSMTGLVEKTVRVAQNSIPRASSAITRLVPTSQIASSCPTPEIGSSDFSKLAAAMRAEGDDVGFPETLLSILQENNVFVDDPQLSDDVRAILTAAADKRQLFDSKIHQHVKWKEFLLFLALSHLGKKLANEALSAACNTPMTLKNRELKAAQEILRQIMGRIGVEEYKIALFSILLSYDTLGLYCCGSISKNEVIDNLIEMAFKANLTMNVMYEMVEFIHEIEVASNPRSLSLNSSDQRQKLADEIKDYIRLTDVGRGILNTLTHQARSGLQGNETIGEQLSRNGNALFHYLRLLHGMMLIDAQDENANKEIYRSVKRDFRDIFLAVRKEKGAEFLPTQYVALLNLSGGRRAMDVFGNRTLDGLFYQSVESEDDNDYKYYFSALLDELVNFRKDYLMRFSKDKVKRFLTIEKPIYEQAAATSAETLECDKVQYLDLMRLTFIHGSNSAILPNLPLTDMQMVSSGRLFEMGIVPFSGELSEGATSGGVNRTLISGTSLDNGERALSYANTPHFHTKLDEEVKAVESFIASSIETLSKSKTFYENERSASQSRAYTMLRVSILRIRSLDPDAFSKFEPELVRITNRMEADFNLFKFSRCYRTYMPKEEDKDGKLGYGWHDYYWYRHFSATENGIQGLKHALTVPIFVSDGVQEAIKGAFPVIFGSTSLNPLTFNPCNPSERCSVKAAKLGKDLQYIFADKNNMDSVRSYLKIHGLEHDVKVLDVSVLEQAIHLNRIAAPYFCDIASRKKIAA